MVDPVGMTSTSDNPAPVAEAEGGNLNVLVTGAFGNLGHATVHELLRHGHRVRCFDVPNRANERTRATFAGRIEAIWGDIRDEAQVRAAVADQDAVIHNAAIIPPPCEQRPERSRAVNVDGTRHVLAAMQASPRRPKLVFTSSVSIYGPSPDRQPPLRADDPVRATDHYTTHKIECEALIREATIPWVILRVGVSLDPATLAGDLDALRMMFEVDGGQRLEYVHPGDVARAQANALRCPDAAGRVLLIGGGANCRITQRELFGAFCDALGIGRLPDAAFGTRSFYTDWMDTDESQRLLQFQTLSFADYRTDLAYAMRHLRWMLYPLRPAVRAYLLRQSGPWRARRHAGG